jgi:hypothetical protein
MNEYLQHCLSAILLANIGTIRNLITSRNKRVQVFSGWVDFGSYIYAESGKCVNFYLLVKFRKRRC